MSEPIRQLAAIMFTDIVGYTALMGKDLNKALEIIEQIKYDANKSDGSFLDVALLYAKMNLFYDASEYFEKAYLNRAINFGSIGISGGKDILTFWLIAGFVLFLCLSKEKERKRKDTKIKDQRSGLAPAAQARPS